MVFEVSTAKKQILEKLAERAWSPTDLAEELDKSRNTVYNHLEDLHNQGALTKRKVAAKTRPKTEYSIGDGFIQYIAALPGQYTEKTLELTPEKQATLRIWNLPQEELQPYIEKYWWRIKNSADLDHQEDIKAVAVYGSVARGQADKDSDIDFLIVTKDKNTENVVAENLGSLRIQTHQGSKIGMTEAYSMEEYRNSLAHQSDFLHNIQDELHIIYDPERILQTPEKVLQNEQ
jgi:predicted nucleotidyltransferase/DNA-binding HxlR family transcriptional regulator